LAIAGVSEAEHEVAMHANRLRSSQQGPGLGAGKAISPRAVVTLKKVDAMQGPSTPMESCRARIF